MRVSLTRAALMLAPFCIASEASALVFTGSMTAFATVGPDASCAPLLNRGTIVPGSSSGISSLGSFTYGHSVCNLGATGPVIGTFAISFADDGFTGTLDGNATASSTPGVFTPDFTYTILGGTGRFLGATGTFDASGTIDARNRPTQLAFNYEGQINAPAVPEPGTWGMMLMGFGLCGWALRRRAAQPSPA